MGKNDSFWIIGTVVLLMIVYGGFVISENISEERSQFMEDHKWDLGEMRNGVTLISIKVGWSYTAVFYCEGKTYEMRSGDARVLPSGDVIHLLRVYPR